MKNADRQSHTERPSKMPPPPRTSGLLASFQIRHQAPLPWRKAIGAPIATAIAVLIGLGFGHFVWGVWAFFGAFTSLYVSPAPYQKRGVVLLFVGLGLVASLAVGSLSSVSWWIMAIGLGVVAGGSAFFTGAFEVPPPASLIFILIACIGAALPVDPAATPLRVGMALLGALVAWIVGMIGWPFHPHKPETEVVQKAYTFLGTYAGHLGDRSKLDDQGQATIAVKQAENTVLEAKLPWTHDPAGFRLLTLAHQAQEILRSLIALSTEDPHPLPKPWVETLQQIAKNVKGHAHVTLPQKGLGSGPAWSRFHREMTRTVSLLNHAHRRPARVPAIPMPRPGTRIKSAFSGTSVVGAGAMRLGIAVAAATVLSRALGAPHPYWAPLTCGSILQGTSIINMTQRSVQRILGTLVGVFLGLALVALHPDHLMTLGLMMALQFLLLIMVVRNYGISVVFITALALIVIDGEIHPAVTPLVQARIFETLIGAAVGVAAALFLWPRVSSKRLPDALSTTIRKAGELFRQSTDSPSEARARLALETAVLNLRGLYENAIDEVPPSKRVENLWPLVAATERLGFLTMADCEKRPLKPDPERTRTWHDVFKTLSLAAKEGHLGETPSLPTIPGCHSIRHGLKGLVDAFQVIDDSRLT